MAELSDISFLILHNRLFYMCALGRTAGLREQDMHAEASTTLEGKSILFVEHSHFLALELYQAFEALGATILGPIHTTREADLLLRFLEISGVVVDKDLTQAHDLMALLKANGVPAVFSCNEPQCRSGRDGCYRLTDANCDPILLLRTLFPETTH